MSRALRSRVIKTLGIGMTMAAFFAVPRQSRLGRNTGLDTPVGVVVVHRAMHYDVSRPLASMREQDDTTELADCEGAACGTSPGAPFDDHPDTAQEQRPDEAIPP